MLSRSLRVLSTALLAIAATGMVISSMAQAQMANVTATRTGSLGENSVGVGGVANEPLRAEIVVLTGRNHLQCEATHVVFPNQEVLSGGQAFRASMSADGSDGLGSVGFMPLPQKMIAGRPLPADSVVLDGGDGSLRVDGPDVQTATDMRIIGFNPNAQHPVSARAEQWPASLGREDTAPADVRNVELIVGQHLTFGHAEAEVLAIEGATSEHPARAIFRLYKPMQGSPK